ncbi:MAG: DUF3800 domain-containing protein [Gammaproteobacteria bacterium]|nr:DUF3800 domain-containing protein [Gammaproteobacteria bacterium]
MSHSDYIIYVDESGDHSLDGVNPDYPVFVLDFCIFRKEHYVNRVVPNVQAFKFAHFGHDIVILHEHEIRKQKPPFVFLQNQDKRAVFMDELNQLVEISDLTIIAAAIRKQMLTKAYGSSVNPYELALCFCMERAFAFLQESEQQAKVTHIVVERRGKREDNELELAFRRIREGADRWQRLKMPNFKLVFADKKINSAGLQLADLTARPIGRYTMNPDQPNRAWNIIEKKLRRSPTGQTDGWGLKVFP